MLAQLKKMKIKQVNFPQTQFSAFPTKKAQIYLHHTAGNSSGEGNFHWWASNPERVATCVCISGPGSNDGEIVQGFHSSYWAYHLGVRPGTFRKFGLYAKNLDKASIGIEICNWGQLSERDGKFYNYVGGEVKDVIKLDKPFKGWQYFHNYSDAQIESVRLLLIKWSGEYGIPLTYNPDIWDLTPRALKGEPGVFTHNSVRPDKVDVYPHPKLIQMLKSF